MLLPTPDVPDDPGERAFGDRRCMRAAAAATNTQPVRRDRVNDDDDDDLRHHRETNYCERSGHVRVTLRSPWSDTPTVFHKFHFNMTLERKKQTPLLGLLYVFVKKRAAHGW